jgi:hypothetical protein
MNAMVDQGILESEDEIENDHIAFRTIGVPHFGVSSLEKIFLHYGCKKMDYYFFPEKKFNAWWYAPSAEKLPGIFISELRVEDLRCMLKEPLRLTLIALTKTQWIY